MVNDSQSSIFKISAQIDKLLPVIKVLLAGFLLLAAWSVIAHNTLPWQIPLPLLLIGGFLWWRPLSAERQFLMLIVYCAAGMAAVEVWHAKTPLLGALSVKQCGDALIGVAALVAVFKIQFRKFGEFYLSTADFLALGICILFLVATQQRILSFEMNGALFRTILVLLAIRCVAFRSKFEQNLIVGGAMGFMLLVVVVGVMGLF